MFTSRQTWIAHFVERQGDRVASAKVVALEADLFSIAIATYRATGLDTVWLRPLIFNGLLEDAQRVAEQMVVDRASPSRSEGWHIEWPSWA